MAILPKNVETRSTDLGILHPHMRAAVEAVVADLKSSGIPLFPFEAFRTPQRQAFLYAQGRTKPGKIVTYAEPWSSYHQYGLAVDFVFGGPGKWTWDEPKKGMWKKFHEIGAKYGLMRLDFETPHLQLAGLSSSALRQGVYPDAGDAAWIDALGEAIESWSGKPGAAHAQEAGAQEDSGCKKNRIRNADGAPRPRAAVQNGRYRGTDRGDRSRVAVGQVRV